MIKNNICRILILAWICICLLPVTAFGTDGEGEGGGLNQDEPLTLISCNLLDEQKDVPQDIVIEMQFSKNVVNMAVAENNKSCISLTDADGNAVAAEVKMGDDQIDPSVKRIIQLVPVTALLPDQSYRLLISDGLRSKSGAVLEAPIEITFHTAGSNAGSGDTTEAKGGSRVDFTKQSDSDTGKLVTAAAVLPESAAQENTVTQESTVIQEKTTDTETNTLNPWMVFSAVCFAVAAVLFIIYASHNRKK